MKAARRADRGVALVAAILLMLLLSVTGLGLVLTASLEPLTCRNVEVAAAARLAAEAGVTVAARELADVDDWSSVLQGVWRSAWLDTPLGPGPASAGRAAPTWESLTHLATCGRESSCTEAQRRRVTLERPWGDNNPSWVWLGLLRIGGEGSAPTSPRFDVGVWAGDDGTEADADPTTDGGPSADGLGGPFPGSGIVRLRAEAFGLRGEHGRVDVLAVRGAAPGSVRLVWGMTAP